MKRYLIEDLLPLAELSKEAKREKAIRHGHISTLHVWWSRKPLTVARAAVFSALMPAPESAEEREKLMKLLLNLCKWEVHPTIVEEAQKLIRQNYSDGPPKVLDSFAGGGSIPLEALRLGCEAHAVEYNPVAYLMLKCTVEYPQKYGSKLAEDVSLWGKWVLDRARQELSEFYPKEPDGMTPIAYLWRRTVKCPNPACGAEIPLAVQWWLARKANKRIALKPIVNRYEKRVGFEVETVDANEDWPSQGTVKRATAHCLVCGGTADDDYLRSEAEAGRMGHRLVAVVKTAGRGSGRQYEVANSKHIEAFEKAACRLKELKAKHEGELSLMPDEPSPGTIGQGASQRPTYGLTEWGKYFNPRQALALVTFARLVREAHYEIKKECCDEDYAKAVATYLGLALDSVANRNCVLAGWDSSRDTARSVFAGHHLHMAWDYAEINPFSNSTGAWDGAIEWIEKVTEDVAAGVRGALCSKPKAVLGSAASLSLKDSSLHAVVIDPPYYDNVPYADLSDFFYCLTPEALIVTEQGYLPIAQIKVGMRVLSHKQRWTPVTAVSERYYRGPILSIHVAHCSPPLRITPGHKVLARKRGAIKAEWVPAEQLGIRDFILMPTPKPQHNTEFIYLNDWLQVNYPKDEQWLYYGRVSDETLAIHQALNSIDSVRYGDLKRLAASLQVRHDKVQRLRHAGAPNRLRVRNQIRVNQDFATLIGYYMAEGSVTLRSSGRHAINFVFHAEEEEYIQEVEHLMENVFGIKGKRQHRKNEKALALTFHCTPIAEFLANVFGKASASKKLPAWFLDLPDDALAAFIRGFWNGDGSLGDEFGQLTTLSAALAGQVRVTLQRLGVITHVYWDNKERVTQWNGKAVRSQPRFLLKTWGKYRLALSNIVGIHAASRREGHYLGTWDEKGYWAPIRRIEVMDYDGLVYNLETGDNSYTTAQGCVHNCWLKRSVGHLYPEAFSTQLVPKDEEIVHNPARWLTAAKTKRHQDDNPNCACAKCISHRHYERLLTQSFQEIHRVLKDDALAVIMFTHKATAAWESLIQSLLNAGLYPTASWPVHTEMEASTHTRGKGSIVSTILLVCRKRQRSALSDQLSAKNQKQDVGWYHEIKPELEARVRERLQKFWESGISGADFFVSAIGPAVEIFGRYDKVVHPSGEIITVSELLDEVRRLVADFALAMILKAEGVGQVDAPTRFYVLFRWAYDANEVPYDDARKLSQALGVELDALAQAGLAKKTKDKVKVLSALERDPKAFEKGEGRESLLINALHKALVFWSKGQLEELQKFLAEEGLLEAERFWRAAQALITVLPDGDEERKLLEQLMPSRQGLLRREMVREVSRGQKELFGPEKESG